MAAKRVCLIAGLLLALEGCSGGPRIKGLFNNNADYHAAIKEHNKAWAEQFEGSVSKAQVDAVVRRAGGECSYDYGNLSCVVDTKPSWPSFFLTRHFWHVKLQPVGWGRFSLQSSHVDLLGWDL
jgi:hypothetical protein